VKELKRKTERETERERKKDGKKKRHVLEDCAMNK